MRHPSILTYAAVVTAALLGQPVHAQTQSGWTGTNNALWSNSLNWSNGAPASGTVVDLSFGNAFVTAGGTGQVTSNNDLAGYSGYRITFDNTPLGTDPAFTITGNGFTLSDFGGAFPKIENLSTSTQTFNLNGAITLTGGAAGKAEINAVNGNLVFSATTPIVLNSPLDILGNNGATITFDGVISGAAANPITLKENSTVVFSAANTFAGPVNVQAGTVRATSNAAALGTGVLNLQGGSLELANDTGLNFGRATTISGNTMIASDTFTNGAAGVTHTLGTLSIGAQLLTVAVGANVASGTAGITFGATTLTGNAVVEVNGGALLTLGTVTLGANNLAIGGAGNSVISGSTAGTGGTLTMSGTGLLRITADPNQTGVFTVNDGVLELDHTGSTDGPKVINGGALRTIRANMVGDAQTVTVNSGGTWDMRGSDTISQILGGGIVTTGAATGTITLTTNSTGLYTWGGVIQNGPTATMAYTKAGSGTVTFTSGNSYTGNTAINTGAIIVQGPAARLSNGGIVTVGDNNGNDESLTLGSTSDLIVGTLDRVGDTSTIRFNGTTNVFYNGAASGGAIVETASSLDFFGGAGTLSLNPAAGGEVQLNFGTLTRTNNNAIGVVRGTGLGIAAGTPDSSRVLFTTTAPATVGLDGTGPSASIIPFLLGGNSTTAVPDTFVRYDSVNGVIPLGAADYAPAIAGSAGQNVSLSAVETVSADAVINALRVTAGGATLGGSTKVLARSGALLFTSSGTIDGSGSLTLGGALTNGNGLGRQGVLTASGAAAVIATISANVATAGGLIIGDAGGAANIFHLSGDNAILGGIVVNNGIVRLGSAGALNDDYFNDLTLRAGNSATNGALSAGVQLNGQSASVVFAGNDRLQGSTRIENGLTGTTSILTIVATADSNDNDGILQNGGAGTLGSSSVVPRRFTLSRPIVSQARRKSCRETSVCRTMGQRA